MNAINQDAWRAVVFANMHSSKSLAIVDFADALGEALEPQIAEGVDIRDAYLQTVDTLPTYQGQLTLQEVGQARELLYTHWIHGAALKEAFTPVNS